jgi:hypothetical protein
MPFEPQSPHSDPSAQRSAAALDHDRTTAALLYLLVQAATRGACMPMLFAIGQHLERLAANRETGSHTRGTALRLHELWLRALADAARAGPADAAARPGVPAAPGRRAH